MTSSVVLPSSVASVANVAEGWPERLGQEAYYGLAGDIVRTIEPHSESDPVALLIQTLVMFGNVLGRTAHFAVEADKHYTNEYCLLVGKTSKARKGLALNQVLRCFRNVDSEWLDERKVTGLSSGEGLIWAVRDPIEKQEPVRDRGRIVNYETVITDHGIDDKRLMVIEPEFASVLRVMGRDGNNLSPVIREAWDSGDLSTLTKNSPAKSTAAHTSIIGHITADEFRRYLDRTEAANGFMNRFLVICVSRSKLLPEGGNLRDEDLKLLAKQLSSAVNFARRTKRIKFDRDALTLWYDVYPELSEGRPGLLGAMTGRSEAHTVRLALIYALLDESRVIQKIHLQAALELWRYAEASVAFVFGDAIGDPFVDELERAIRSHENGMTRTEIRDHFKRHRKKDQIDRALRVLLELGRIRRVKEETGGRPTERWVAI